MNFSHAPPIFTIERMLFFTISDSGIRYVLFHIPICTKIYTFVTLPDTDTVSLHHKRRYTD